ncbi:hypothetical protein T4A_1172 [Trichinella pseudospiralis]|uniref:Uncharacterized protein n=1 Tax=Trichinella pseudospiralis TaxID=6337 RepID=A0A0V1E6Z6_TRIPS|nr:hypothetical protein T4A_1172 [Trichinella pseudospiralis]
MCSQKNNSLVCRCWRDQSVKIPSWNCPKFHRIRKTEHGNQNNAPAMNDRPPATTMRLYYTSREKRCGIWLRFTYRSCAYIQIHLWIELRLLRFESSTKKDSGGTFFCEPSAFYGARCWESAED